MVKREADTPQSVHCVTARPLLLLDGKDWKREAIDHKLPKLSQKLGQSLCLDISFNQLSSQSNAYRSPLLAVAGVVTV